MLEHSTVELSIALMAYNEAENLVQLLHRIRESLENVTLSYEVLVIDTVEPLDDTESVCRRFNNVFYINRRTSNSYGDAIRTSIAKAKGRFLLIMDSDGSHFPEFIPKMIKDRDQYDLIVASRYIAGGRSDNSAMLVLLSKIVNSCYALLLNLRCSDVSNSFRLYRTEMLREFDLKCHHFDIMEEILYKLSYYNENLRIQEIPYHFRKRIHGNSRRAFFVFAYSYFLTLLKLLFLKCRTKGPRLRNRGLYRGSLENETAIK